MQGARADEPGGESPGLHKLQRGSSGKPVRRRGQFLTLHPVFPTQGFNPNCIMLLPNHFQQGGCGRAWLSSEPAARPDRVKRRTHAYMIVSARVSMWASKAKAVCEGGRRMDRFVVKAVERTAIRRQASFEMLGSTKLAGGRTRAAGNTEYPCCLAPVLFRHTTRRSTRTRSRPSRPGKATSGT